MLVNKTMVLEKVLPEVSLTEEESELVCFRQQVSGTVCDHGLKLLPICMVFIIDSIICVLFFFFFKCKVHLLKLISWEVVPCLSYENPWCTPRGGWGASDDVSVYACASTCYFEKQGHE